MRVVIGNDNGTVYEKGDDVPSSSRVGFGESFILLWLNRIIEEAKCLLKYDKLRRFHELELHYGWIR